MSEVVYRSCEDNPVILAVDVQYSENQAFVAGICFGDWSSTDAEAEYTTTVEAVADYEPGRFFRREMPCILALLEEHRLRPATLVIDGHVYLDGREKPGLGKHLFDTLNGQVAVVGVAKKAFMGMSSEYKLLRGESLKPLYITTTGDLNQAKQGVSNMAGKHRIPMLLKRADQLCRELAKQQR